MKTKDEVIAFIDAQLDNGCFLPVPKYQVDGWYVDKDKRNNGGLYHYGRVQLSYLVDFIYEDQEDKHEATSV